MNNIYIMASIDILMCMRRARTGTRPNKRNFVLQNGTELKEKQYHLLAMNTKTMNLFKIVYKRTVTTINEEGKNIKREKNR